MHKLADLEVVLGHKAALLFRVIAAAVAELTRSLDRRRFRCPRSSSVAVWVAKRVNRLPGQLRRLAPALGLDRSRRRRDRERLLKQLPDCFGPDSNPVCRAIHASKVDKGEMRRGDHRPRVRAPQR